MVLSNTKVPTDTLIIFYLSVLEYLYLVRKHIKEETNLKIFIFSFSIRDSLEELRLHLATGPSQLVD